VRGARPFPALQSSKLDFRCLGACCWWCAPRPPASMHPRQHQARPALTPTHPTYLSHLRSQAAGTPPDDGVLMVGAANCWETRTWQQARTRTRTHTHTRARTHTHTHIHIHTHARARMHACTHAPG